MESLRFIKWWWTKQLCDTDRSYIRFIGGMFFFMGCMVAIGYFFGVGAVLRAFWTFIGIGILSIIVYAIAGQWKKYLKHKEEEAREIIDRLKGDDEDDIEPTPALIRGAKLLAKFRKPTP